MGVYGEGTDPNKQNKDNGDPNYVAQGNFGLTYRPITNAYPSAAVGQYPVRAGDTLKSIAQSSYGDSSLWYLIADANGLRTDADLRVGQTLVIPNGAIGSKNTADTYQPYDQSRIVGSTTPNIPMPANKGCGVIGMIMVIVVTAVAAYFTAGAALAVLGPAMGALSVGFAASTVAGAIGAAVGSAAGQLVGMAMGMQESFSWKQVAVAAATSVLGAGSGAISGIQNTALRVGAAALNAAAQNAASQGIAILVGTQDKFSWKSMAMASLSAGLNTAADKVFYGGALSNLGHSDNSLIRGNQLVGAGETVLREAMNGVIRQSAVSMVVNGRVNIKQVATDSFGNALASATVNALQHSGGPEWLFNKLGGFVQNAIHGQKPLPGPGGAPGVGRSPAYGGQVVDAPGGAEESDYYADGDIRGFYGGALVDSRGSLMSGMPRAGAAGVVSPAVLAGPVAPGLLQVAGGVPPSNLTLDEIFARAKALGIDPYDFGEPGMSAEQLWLGLAAHEIIGITYAADLGRIGEKIYANHYRIPYILERSRTGDPDSLLDFEKDMKPDITNSSEMDGMEIKPAGNTPERSAYYRELAKREERIYLRGLNRGAYEGIEYRGAPVGSFDGDKLIPDPRDPKSFLLLTWRTTDEGAAQYAWLRADLRKQAAGDHAAGWSWDKVAPGRDLAPLPRYGGKPVAWHFVTSTEARPWAAEVAKEATFGAEARWASMGYRDAASTAIDLVAQIYNLLTAWRGVQDLKTPIPRAPSAPRDDSNVIPLRPRPSPVPGPSGPQPRLPVPPPPRRLPLPRVAFADDETRGES
ncbi:MAG: LysM peptidoglycan-binding domain-containing protein [Anaeromyxobacter sp.]